MNTETTGALSSNRAQLMEHDLYGATNVVLELAGMGRGIERQHLAESLMDKNDDLAEDPVFSVSLPKH